ncbi:hypothetical protein [Flavobacterium cerinum]|uniref:DUF416 family protein n=1 Tax=Flavobacterium cerinum TaxID=2502784 RepID=A0ABY5IUD2_9FLAO|nr:hypothetical protein [Flavobacterium cerinum]UUC45971.1 hypothetical protein NOX80_01920 [Flavobacterium cerinum]
MSPFNFETFRQKYPDDCKTKSNNSCVLALYSIVLAGEHKDSDYWNEEHGASDIIRLFETIFTTYDWEELEADLKNWTTSQLELFTEAILSGYYSYTNNGIYNDHYDIEKLTQTIPNRLNLLLPILAIEKERDLQYHELSWIIVENSNFINDHFEIVLQKDPQHLNTIKTIFESFARFDSTDPMIITLKNKIDNVSNK